VAGCCECGDEPSGSCATELVSYVNKISSKLESIGNCKAGHTYRKAVPRNQFINNRNHGFVEEMLSF
jgi:hypothetical protein